MIQAFADAVSGREPPLREVADLRREMKRRAPARTRSASSARASRSRPTCRPRPSPRAASSNARSGTVEVRPEYAPGLDRIEDYSHIVVLFHFHKAGSAKLTVTSRRGRRRSGASSRRRSPHRPNPLGMSVLRLLRRDGRVLDVSGLDLVDGTPVLDIKPYTRRDRKSRIRTADS